MPGSVNLLHIIENDSFRLYGMPLNMNYKWASGLMTNALLAMLNRGINREDAGDGPRSSTECMLCLPATIGWTHRSSLSCAIVGMDSALPKVSRRYASVSCCLA